jgi:saccharopine dehydrogenase-like NADP-dependent oxidoreductase
MKTIVLFGAGKSATALIHYLLENAEREDWQLLVVDADQELAESKIQGSVHGKAISFDIRNPIVLTHAISHAALVISLLPPALHSIIAHECIAQKKNLLTASYVDESIKKLETEVVSNDLLFLCEMGLDPGIDHMSAKKIIDSIHAEDGEVVSFISHCGGLVAPENDNNPWHYKISWNPRNVVMAGKAGAIYKNKGVIEELEYEQLFEEKRYVAVPDNEVMCWYPNRDSLKYINIYGLGKAGTFIRTTLRHPDFMYGWKNLIELKLTDEEKIYNTDGKTLAEWFKEHMDKNGFNEWLEKRLKEQFESTKNLLSELVNLVKFEEEAAEKGVKQVDEFMMVDEKGDLKKIDIDYLKIKAAATHSDNMHDSNNNQKQLFFLGLNDTDTYINKGICSAADVLQFALENKLALEPVDKDMVIMLHEIEYIRDNEGYKYTSCLSVTGEDAIHTAMAKTVGLPLGIAAKLILDGTIKTKGIQIPVIPEIYEPVLKELEKNGIVFKEHNVKV